jgi:transglutaminase-like putative cysteine protease
MSARRRGRPPPEHGIALRVAVLVAVMASAWAALDEGAGGTALRAAVLLGLPGGFAYSYATRRHTGRALKVCITIGLLAAFAGFLGQMTQLQGSSVAEVQVPLAELFIWVQLLHAVDVPARRDLMFSLVSAAALAAIASVLSVSVAIAPLLVLWAAASVASLALAHRSRSAATPRLAPAGGGRRAPGWGRPVAATLLAMVVLGAGVFAVVPAAGTARALIFPANLPRLVSIARPGELVNPGLGPGGAVGSSDQGGAGAAGRRFGYFGFAPELDTGVRGRPDDTLVMRVRASGPDFWRGQTFDAFDGRVWRRSADEPRALRSRSPFLLPLVPADGPRQAGTDDLVQTYYLERAGPNVIFAAYSPSELYFTDRTIFQLPDGSLRTGVELPAGSVYTVVSRRPDATEATLRASTVSPETVPAPIATRYLGTEAVPPRVAALARRVAAGIDNPYDAVRALERWMGDHTRYTLDVAPLPAGANSVEQFLFVDREGFCEQIATSLVMMLRSLGIPARLAVGYVTGERNPFTGLYEVRADDAHAWAEVYFPGVGWQGFDPTADVPLAGDARAGAAGRGALAYLSARLPDPPAWAPRAALGLGGALVLAGAGWAAWRRARRRRAARPRSWAAVRVARLERAGARRGRPRAPDETVREYAVALDAMRLRPVADVLDAELYSGDAPSPAARAAADAALDSFHSPTCVTSSRSP